MSFHSLVKLGDLHPKISRYFDRVLDKTMKNYVGYEVISVKYSKDFDTRCNQTMFCMLVEITNGIDFLTLDKTIHITY